MSFVTLLTRLYQKLEYEYTMSKIPSKSNTNHHYGNLIKCEFTVKREQ